MKAKIIFFILLMFYLTIYGQIKIEISSVTKISEYERVFVINLINTSNEKYIVPIDTTDFKPYFEDEQCFYHEKEKGALVIDANELMLQFVFLKDYNGIEKNIEQRIGSNFSDIIQSEKRVQDEYINNISRLRKKHKKIIKQWKIDNKIKNNIKWAEINYQLVSNIIKFEPFQKITYAKKINTQSIYYSKLYKNAASFLYYLDEDIIYSFFLMYCIDNKLYDYLTNSQKDGLKMYKQFSGILESNVVKW